MKKTNLKVERKVHNTGFYSEDIPTFDELVIINTLVKKKDHFCFNGRLSPASKTNLIMRRLLLSLQSAFPVKLYHPEEDPTVGQISEKDVQCFLCLVVSF